MDQRNHSVAAAKGEQPYFHKGQKQADGFRYSFHFVYFISKQKTLICYDSILQQATGLSSKKIILNSELPYNKVMAITVSISATL